MKNTRLAHRYAKALFDLAVEQNIVDQVYQDAILIKDVCQENKSFLHLLASPIIKTDKKQAIVREIFSKHIHKVTSSFLQIIIKKRREYYISQIVLQYIDHYKAYKSIEVISITSANTLDETTREKILKKLKTFITKEIELIEIVDPAIIGGFIIQYQDNKYDASVSNKIQALTRNFLTNEYIKDF
jgi:F-type H+-transporting ATPase subunit delta